MPEKETLVKARLINHKRLMSYYNQLPNEKAKCIIKYIIADKMAKKFSDISSQDYYEIVLVALRDDNLNYLMIDTDDLQLLSAFNDVISDAISFLENPLNSSVYS